VADRSKPIDLTIVLPAYNEEESLPDALEQCAEFIRQMPELEVEVVVVDDGSSDRTASTLEAWSQATPWLRMIRHPDNRGYGSALKTGFAAARGRLVFYTDSDNQFDILELREILPLIEGADLVAGFRVYRFDPLTRLVVSWAYNRLVRVLFRVPIRDVDCSFKLMRGERLDRLVLMSDDFFIDTEIVARARKWNWRIKEVGVRHYPRRKGRTTVTAGDIPRTLGVVGRMWLAIHYPNREQHSLLSAQQDAARRDLRGYRF
jgi:glycosyltransferase involved in cell wall biosynthesis